MKYVPTIGLEIHAELNTHTKMFCSSKNDPDETSPNVNICPVCMGHPGTLPVINRQAVKHVLSVGVALGGTLADYTEFDRKNYFYPDIPKGYQLSQYAYPLVQGGTLCGVTLTRIHLEEDTARSTHDTGDYSRIDFNRAGVPLMELVTEPVIHDAETAGAFARELQLVLQYLGASHANMEKGEMRVEANISISSDPEKFGTKVEVKNLNSFKVVEKAIAYEIQRQAQLLDAGEAVIQETRGWDENKQITFSQRKKEDSHDYRYFPDPDLPKIKVSMIDEFHTNVLLGDLPELPQAKRERYAREWSLASDQIEFYVKDLTWAGYFEHVAALVDDKAVVLKASNYITSDIVSLVAKGSEFDGSHVGHMPVSEFVEVINMIVAGELSSRGAKDLLQHLVLQGGIARTVADREGLLQKSDSDFIKKIIDDVVVEHREIVDAYKNGKESSLQFLIGQVIKQSKGAANPLMVKDILIETLA